MKVGLYKIIPSLEIMSSTDSIAVPQLIIVARHPLGSSRDRNLTDSVTAGNFPLSHRRTVEKRLIFARYSVNKHAVYLGRLMKFKE